MLDKNAIFKWLIFAAVVTASLVFVTPVKEKIRLGLDLAGGTSFTVQIDQAELRAELKEKDPNAGDAQIDNQIKDIMTGADDRTIEVLRNRIDGLGVNEPVIVSGSDHRIIIEIPGADEKQREVAKNNIKSAAYLKFCLVDRKSDEMVSRILADEKVPEGYIKVRVNGQNCYKRLPPAEYNKIAQTEGYKRRLASFGYLNTGCLFMLEAFIANDGGTYYRPIIIRKKETKVKGEMLERAEIDTDVTTGKVQVSIAFDAEGAEAFAEVTRENVGRQLAIILDDTLYSAPVINEEIAGGNAVISGNFTREEAAQLRNVLNAGSLPAPIKILEERSIDPSLGRDAIRSGIRASIIGATLVVIFMMAYYCFLGLVADIALVLNVVLLPLGAILVSGFFSSIGAVDTVAASSAPLQLPVLTMPGIAGIVLTIGMAVDANVLIFERIREELKSGKSTMAAVMAGYDRAFLAIFDSNLTTFLTAIILFIFGSGPIRGFAITLSAGIIVSMYSALVVTKMIFKLCLKETSKAPKIANWFKFPCIDFVAKGRTAILFSVAVIVITLGIFAFKCVKSPQDVLAVDFTGGTVMTYTFTEGKAPSEKDIKAKLAVKGIKDVVCQRQSQDLDEGKKSEFISIKTALEVDKDNVEVGQSITTTLQAEFPESGISEKARDHIGSQIGKDLKVATTKAVIFALIMMLIYISIRFEFGFALGAVVALLHDVLITIGLFTLFGRQIGVTAIACFLTIVGYSVNDTIVIFDRIREELKKDGNISFRELCNRCVTETLGRTVITSVTTFLAVLSLLIFGGGAIFDFALCMTIGIIAGVYSTIFIATPVMIAWYKGKRPGIAKKAE